MTLAIAALLTWLLACTFLGWRAILEREIRWKFYALRDRLRWAVIQDRDLAGSRLFVWLDESLTRYCASLEDISLWMLVPVVLNARARAEIDAKRIELEAELASPENAAFAPIFEQSALLIVEHLVYRHIFMFVLVTIASLLWTGTKASIKNLSGGLIAAPFPVADDCLVPA